MPLPALTASDLGSALRTGYGLAAAAVTGLAGGYDFAASVYRVSADDGQTYFLKVRRGAVNQAGLAVPAYLRAHGLPEVLAPLPNLTGALWHAHQGCALSLYPFLPDALPLPSNAADDHWRQFGALLRRVHAAALPPEVSALLPRETFAAAAAARLAPLDALINTQPFDQPVRRELAAGWRTHAAEIHAVTARAEALGRQLRATPPRPLSLCHADPHWSNVLVDAAGRLWLVDWDDTMLAVPERDLMFVIGGISGDWATPRDTALFLEGYGPVTLDPLALAYYRADWAVQDIGEFAAQVLITPNVSEADQHDALRLFLGQFAPDGMVAIALGSDPAHG